MPEQSQNEPQSAVGSEFVSGIDTGVTPPTLEPLPDEKATPTQAEAAPKGDASPKSVPNETEDEAEDLSSTAAEEEKPSDVAQAEGTITIPGDDLYEELHKTPEEIRAALEAYDRQQEHQRRMSQRGRELAEERRKIEPYVPWLTRFSQAQPEFQQFVNLVLSGADYSTALERTGLVPPAEPDRASDPDAWLEWRAQMIARGSSRSNGRASQSPQFGHESAPQRPQPSPEEIESYLATVPDEEKPRAFVQTLPPEMQRITTGNLRNFDEAMKTVSEKYGVDVAKNAGIISDRIAEGMAEEGLDGVSAVVTAGDIERIFKKKFPRFASEAERTQTNLKKNAQRTRPRSMQAQTQNAPNRNADSPLAGMRKNPIDEAFDVAKTRY